MAIKLLQNTIKFVIEPKRIFILTGFSFLSLLVFMLVSMRFEKEKRKTAEQIDTSILLTHFDITTITLPVVNRNCQVCVREREKKKRSNLYFFKQFLRQMAF